MAKRRRRQYEEEAVELGDVLQPYDQQPVYEETDWQEEEYLQADSQYADMYVDQPYVEEYSEAHEEADLETRFHIAMGMLDLISILVGIVVILVLVAMLVSLAHWLQNDILHSALFMQSGLK